MIKKLARWILRDTINKYEEVLDGQVVQIGRLEELANSLKDEAYSKRGYVFNAEKLTENEQVIIGKCIKHELVGIFKKWFKQRADENADFLIHFPKESEATRMGWSVAVRMYDDLVMQLERCEKIYNNKERIKSAIQKQSPKEVPIRSKAENSQGLR